MKLTFVLIVIISIFSLTKTQANPPTGPVNTGANSGSGSGGTTGGTTGQSGQPGTQTNPDGSQGYNQGYSYNTGIRPYQTGFTFYQPFGDEANKQQNGNTAGAQNTGANPGLPPVAAAQPVAPAGYQPGYNVFSPPVNGQPVSGQPVQYQNVPQFVHYGPPPPVSGVPVSGVPAQPIQIQPINLANFDSGLPILEDLGLGGIPAQTRPTTNRRNNKINNNQAQIPNLGDGFGGSDFSIPVLGGGGGGGGGNRGNGGNGFFTPPNANNGFFGSNNNNNNNNNDNYDSLPDDSSLANFANLGGGGGDGGGQSNDYPDNDFLGGFGSATNNRDTFDIPLLGDGFFRRK